MEVMNFKITPPELSLIEIQKAFGFKTSEGF